VPWVRAGVGAVCTQASVNRAFGPRGLALMEAGLTPEAAVKALLATPYYGAETLGGKNYFTAVYADMAVAPACIDCHNEHQDSPRKDFDLGDVMGGVVIRIPLDS
jgi:hypothetical protein